MSLVHTDLWTMSLMFFWIGYRLLVQVYLCYYASNDLFIFSRVGYLLYFIPKPIVFAIFIRGKSYSKIALVQWLVRGRTFITSC